MSRNVTGCAISFRKMERRRAGWEGRRRKKGEGWREGKHVRMDHKRQVLIQFWSLADQSASPVQNDWFAWSGSTLRCGFWVSHRARAQWQNADQAASLDFKCSQIWVYLDVQFGIMLPIMIHAWTIIKPHFHTPCSELLENKLLASCECRKANTLLARLCFEIKSCSMLFSLLPHAYMDLPFYQHLFCPVLKEDLPLSAFIP